MPVPDDYDGVQDRPARKLGGRCLAGVIAAGPLVYQRPPVYLSAEDTYQSPGYMMN